ncbi:MAG: phage/plasmid primase, P4 family [Halobacteriota archaeon]|jgi:putative DNA primase/helicase
MSSEEREDGAYTPSNGLYQKNIGLTKDEGSDIGSGGHSVGEVIAWLRREDITPMPIRPQSKAPWHGITQASLECDTSFLIPTLARLQAVSDYWDSRDWRQATPKDISISIGVLKEWNNGVYVAIPDIDNPELVDDFVRSAIFNACPIVKGKKGAKLIAKVVSSDAGEAWPETPIQWRPISNSSDGPELELFTGDAKKHCVIYGEHDKSTPEHPIFYDFARGFGDTIPTLAFSDVLEEMDRIASSHGLVRLEQGEPTRAQWQALRAQTNSNSGVTICEQYDIQMCDVIAVPLNARKTSSGYLFKHPVHGATGQGNLFVNPRLNLWYCFRCGAGGDPLTYVAVREGFIECNQAGPLDKETVKKCIDVLRHDGLVPELKAEVVISSVDEEQFEITFGKHLSDLGNAERFVERFGESVRYCKEMNAWFVWDGHRWVQDKTDKIVQFAVQVPSIIDMEVGLIDRLPGKSEEEKRKMKDVYRQWARTSEYKNRLHALVDLAKTFADVVIRAQQWDCDNWLLNVRNGTLNLKTGELREHNREDYITKYLPIDYDADASNERWGAFLERCIPNDALCSFLQRAAGYSLTGLTVQEAIFFLYGEPATGKSTFLEALLAVWGDYGIPSSFNAFLTQRGNVGGPREDVTRLNGARMVLCSEVNRNTTWNAALIKSLSSGDKMTARNPYASYSIEFEPIFKLWLGANYRPKCDYDDEAVFRRFNIVPFNVRIPEEQRDRGLKDYFKNDEEARKAILAWGVAGCLEWVKGSEGGADGLQAPEEVSAATNEYQQAMHPLYVFIKNECEVGADEKTGKPYEVLVDDLWDAFTNPKKYYYTRSLQSIVPSKKSFGKHLSSFGFTRRRETKGYREYYWVGLRLLDEGEDNSVNAPVGVAGSRPDDSLSHLSAETSSKRDENKKVPVNDSYKGTSSRHSHKEQEQNAPVAHAQQPESEPADLSEIPQLIHDYLLVVKQQQQGKKLRPDLLRSMVGNTVKDLSDGRFSVPTVLDYYDRLNGYDAEITALISSICGGEHLRGAR